MWLKELCSAVEWTVAPAQSVGETRNRKATDLSDARIMGILIEGVWTELPQDGQRGEFQGATAAFTAPFLKLPARDETFLIAV
jgi:hypothetical protein